MPPKYSADATDGEHFELLCGLLRPRRHAVGAIGNGCIHQYKSRQIFGAVSLNVRGNVLNPLRPSNENRVSHAEALQQRVQILRTHLRCIASRRLCRVALRTRIECNNAICFCERIDLMLPDICAGAPARDEDQDGLTLRLGPLQSHVKRRFRQRPPCATIPCSILRVLATRRGQ
jgi:hypothetical protein